MWAEMTFTDDDLKRLKESTDYDPEIGVTRRALMLRALVARLEAAEKCIPYLGTYDHDSPEAFEAIDAWSEAKGAEND
jgi:hypothetical protein